VNIRAGGFGNLVKIRGLTIETRLVGLFAAESGDSDVVTVRAGVTGGQETGGEK
jgi:hypothetical protein